MISMYLFLLKLKGSIIGCELIFNSNFCDRWSCGLLSGLEQITFLSICFLLNFAKTKALRRIPPQILGRIYSAKM